MSDDTTADDGRSAAETDWLAHSVYGYGFGFTKEQALAAMTAAVKATDRDTVTVDLVEHVGDAKTGMSGWEVEEFVSGERIEIDGEAFNSLRDAAITVDGEAMYAIEDAAESESITFDPPTPEN